MPELNFYGEENVIGLVHDMRKVLNGLKCTFLAVLYCVTVEIQRILKTPQLIYIAIKVVYSKNVGEVMGCQLRHNSTDNYIEG